MGAGAGTVGGIARQALLLADRLYGCAAFLAPAQAMCARVGSHFLIRARSRQGANPPAFEGWPAGWCACRCNKKAINASLSSGWKCAKSARASSLPGFRPVQLRLWTKLARSRDRTIELVNCMRNAGNTRTYYRELKHPVAQNRRPAKPHPGNRRPGKSPPSSWPAPCWPLNEPAARAASGTARELY